MDWFLIRGFGMDKNGDWIGLVVWFLMLVVI